MTGPRHVRRMIGAAGVALLVCAVTPPIGRAAHAFADDSIDCATYSSNGSITASAVEYEIPFSSVAGVPYVETEVNSQPQGRARASSAYEGAILEIILNTSGLENSTTKQLNPTTKQVFWPPVQGGKSTAQYSAGPVATSFTSAAAGPEALAYASVGGGSIGGVIGLGPAYTTSQASYHNRILQGHDEAWSYNVSLAGVTATAVHSEITYRTDGTQSGTTGSWAFQMFGLKMGNAPLIGISGDGVSVQGGSPQPGPAGAAQLSSAVDQVGALIQASGAGKVTASFQPGTVQLSAGHVTLQGAGFALRVEPSATKGQIGNAVEYRMGYAQRIVILNTGACTASQDSSTATGPSTLAGTGGSTEASTGGTQQQATSGVAAGPSSSPSAMSPTPNAGLVAAPANPATRRTQAAATLVSTSWVPKFYGWTVLFFVFCALGLSTAFGATRLRRSPPPV